MNKYRLADKSIWIVYLFICRGNRNHTGLCMCRDSHNDSEKQSYRHATLHGSQSNAKWTLQVPHLWEACIERINYLLCTMPYKSSIGRIIRNKEWLMSSFVVVRHAWMHACLHAWLGRLQQLWYSAFRRPTQFAESKTLRVWTRRGSLELI